MKRFIVGTLEKGNLYKDGRSYNTAQIARNVLLRKQKYVTDDLEIMEINVITDAEKIEQLTQELEAVKVQLVGVTEQLIMAEKCITSYAIADDVGAVARKYFKQKEAKDGH